KDALAAGALPRERAGAHLLGRRRRGIAGEGRSTPEGARLPAGAADADAGRGAFLPVERSGRLARECSRVLQRGLQAQRSGGSSPLAISRELSSDDVECDFEGVLPPD